ncbi:MAG: glycosyltransferase family 2 protein, partial [Clostridia bacterium]|nr:glycosyltransferase family 2 protein [Clostridia bacterium]
MAFKKQAKETLTQIKNCSVIIPLYRGKQYIEECLKSLSVQTYSNLEVILMDDGSPDDTVMSDYLEQLIKQTEAGDCDIVLCGYVRRTNE